MWSAKPCDAHHSEFRRILCVSDVSHTLTYFAVDRSVKVCILISSHTTMNLLEDAWVCITWGMISSWRDSKTVAKAKNDLYSSYVGFTRRDHSDGKRWNGVLSRRLTHLCICIERHIVPFLWHNELACAIIDSKYVYNCWFGYSWLLYVATNSKFMNVLHVL